MAKHYKIELAENDLGQLLDGLEIRSESWKRPADCLRTGEMLVGDVFLIDDCSDEEEAYGLAVRYQPIIKNIKCLEEAQP